MLKRLLVPAVLAGIIAAGVIAEVVPTSRSEAGDASTGASATVAKAAGKSSTTAKAVKAAKAFKASLTAAQRKTLQYGFSDSAKQTGWSNLPTTAVTRNGVAVADLSSRQRAKLRTLLRTILSSQGYSEQAAVRKADTYLSQQSGGGGPAGGNSTTYGEDLYSVAFFGTPSRAHKWTVQFGGHHLAIHITFSGSRVSNTPYFVGVEPRTGFTVNGKTYQPMKAKAAALFGAVQALDASQQAEAKLSQTFDDVLVGPQEDGQFPTAQGVKVSSLSAAQRKLVTKAIRAYVDDLPKKQAKKLVATYKKQYAKTYLAWSGATDGTTTGAYARIQGPRVWIEIAVQNGVVLSGTHYHSIERDVKTDYGAGS